MYEFSDRIRYSETDEDGRLHLHSLLDYFQDCSIFHSEAVGMGIPYFKERHLAWLLSSWQICLEELPRLGDPVRVQTWAYAMKAFYGYRNFCMKSEEGKRLAYANSVWVLLDTDTGRPVKVPEHFADTYGLDEQLAMDCSSRKIPVPENPVQKPSFCVPAYFIDSNHHMNNGKYVLSAQEFLPEGYAVKEIRADYKKAAKQGDVLCPAVAAEEKKCTVVLSDEQGSPYCVVEFLAEETK